MQRLNFKYWIIHNWNRTLYIKSLDNNFNRTTPLYWENLTDMMRPSDSHSEAGWAHCYQWVSPELSVMRMRAWTLSVSLLVTRPSLIKTDNKSLDSPYLQRALTRHTAVHQAHLLTSAELCVIHHWPDQAAGAESLSSFNISNDLLAAWAGLSSGYLAVGGRGVSCDVTSDCPDYSNINGGSYSYSE